MGMHSATDRLRQVISTLRRFYHIRHQQMEGELDRFAADFDPDVDVYSGGNIDAPYFPYIQALSEGIDDVLAELGVTLDPVPPGKPGEAGDETLMAGAHLMKWELRVKDAESGRYIGLIEWAMYHRHDRFAVPGPAQISYLKARGGQTMMVG